MVRERHKSATPVSALAEFVWFCKHNPNYFLEQAICEETSYKQWIGTEHAEDMVECSNEKFNRYMRLSQLQEYFVYTRKLNVIKKEYIADVWHKSWHGTFVPYDKDPKLVEWKSVHEFYYDVEYWFERDELMYTMKKVDYKTKFNPLDIEDMLEKHDIQLVKELLDLQGHIWN